MTSHTLADKWRRYIVADSPWAPIKLFDHPPSNADIYAFMQFWEFAPKPPWRWLTAGVRENTWKHATGEKPTKHHAWGLSN